MATYSVVLWDHDTRNDGSLKCGWSDELAREHLEGPNTGLTWRQIGLAIRKLMRCGWDAVSMYVSREDCQ